MQLHRIVTSYFVAGVLVEEGTIASTAPILKWAIGKRLEEFKSWVEKKGGTMESLPVREVKS